jgi:hypothetical protein
MGRGAAGLRHGLFVYEDEAEMVAQAGSFLFDGLEKGEPGLAVLTAAKHELLREALGPSADMIVHFDADGLYTSPLEALAAYDHTMQELVRAGVTTVRAYAELPVGRMLNDWSLWGRYESDVNAVLADHPLWVICGYDGRITTDAKLDALLLSHPEVVDGG